MRWCRDLGDTLNAGVLTAAEENRSGIHVLEGIILVPPQIGQQNKPRAGSCWVMDASSCWRSSCVPWAVLICSHQLGEAEPSSCLVRARPSAIKVLQGVILTCSVGLLSP